MDEILKKSGLQIGRLIRSKKISVEDVYNLHADLITRFNPVLNAAVEVHRDEGLAKARQLDIQLKNQNLDNQPYYGVPFTCKEMFAIKGYRRTGGSYFYKDFVASETSTAINRLDQQNMVLLGTTNVPEYGLWFETKNTFYGRTKNPYNEKKTSGGSSGGEGALIGLGASPMGLGSDIGGSVRIPASFCGVFGHKPSYKMVPLTGHFPNTSAELAKLNEVSYPLTVAGPITRKADDLLPILKILAGQDSIDPQTISNAQSLLNKKPTLKKVYLISDPIIHGTTRTDNDVKKAVETAALYLEQIGHPVEEIKSGFFRDSIAMWSARLSGRQRTTFSQMISPKKVIYPLEEISKLITGKSHHTLPAFILSQMDGRLLEKSEIEHFNEKLLVFKSDFNQLLGETAILLFPTQPRSAPYHNQLFLSPFDFIYSGIFSALELPATQVPMGFDRHKMPIGIQVIGSWGNDTLTIQVARELEAAFGGWQPPEFYT